MITLLAGLASWSFIHFFKRLAPASRSRLDTRLGESAAKGVIALALVISLALIVIGFRSWSAPIIYTPIEALKHLSMLLSFIAIILVAVGHSKSRLRGKFRHPMLLGCILWACAHLLVRGDGASITLFGGIAIWAALSIGLLNKSGPWVKTEVKTSLAGDIRLALISLVLTILIVLIHMKGFGLIA